MKDQFDNQQRDNDQWSDFHFEDSSRNNPFDNENQTSNPSTLITRADFMSHIQIPISNINRVIIPSNSVGNSFKRTCYDREILKDMITEEEFKKVVDELCKIAQKCYSQKRVLDNSKMAPIISQLYFLSFALITSFTFLIYYGTIWQWTVLLIAGIVALIAGIIIVVVIMLKYLITEKEFPTFEEMVKNSLDEYFSHINKQFMKRGLWWRAMPGHYWVELRIDQTLKEDLQKIENLHAIPNLAQQQTLKYSIMFKHDLNAKQQQSRQPNNMLGQKRRNQIIYYQDMTEQSNNVPGQKGNEPPVLDLEKSDSPRVKLPIVHENNNFSNSYLFNNSFNKLNPTQQQLDNIQIENLEDTKKGLLFGQLKKNNDTESQDFTMFQQVKMDDSPLDTRRTAKNKFNKSSQALVYKPTFDPQEETISNGNQRQQTNDFLQIHADEKTRLANSRREHLSSQSHQFSQQNINLAFKPRQSKASRKKAQIYNLTDEHYKIFEKEKDKTKHGWN
ncbi:UNKNOWN [Stylonychia lemnae]|uniref:Transmembrane protein n=1 Tax=Stylonychia lemnae TaxID=5949 RepID=A0A078ADI3_STYLE|nr:UNKNOWN [Stylonychia lemnae]|eukprot:CDW79881.1 UNKNOWN [Stylonychia lemnae]